MGVHQPAHRRTPGRRRPVADTPRGHPVGHPTRSRPSAPRSAPWPTTTWRRRPRSSSATSPGTPGLVRAAALLGRTVVVPDPGPVAAARPPPARRRRRSLSPRPSPSRTRRTAQRRCVTVSRISLRLGGAHLAQRRPGSPPSCATVGTWRVSVAVIGPGTAAAIAEARITADLVPLTSWPSRCSATLPDPPPGGGSASARRGRPRRALPDGLAARGWNVEVVERTGPSASPTTAHPGPGAVPRTRSRSSSSTAGHFVAALGGTDAARRAPAVVACIRTGHPRRPPAKLGLEVCRGCGALDRRPRRRRGGRRVRRRCRRRARQVGRPLSAAAPLWPPSCSTSTGWCSTPSGASTSPPPSSSGRTAPS